MVVAHSTRVLVWSDLFWPYVGGPELSVARLMLELRERGYEFLVVTSHDYLDLPDEASYEGIPVHRLPFRAAIRGQDLSAARGARQAAADLKRAFAPDLVHTTTIGPSLAFHLQTLDAHPAPWLVRLATEVLPSQANGRGTLLQQALRSAAWVVGVSSAVLAQARRLAPEIARHSSVIRHGVDLSVEPRDESPSKVPRLLCLGRLVDAKGFDVALTAFAALVDRYPRLRLTIAGDGSARSELEQQATELGLEDAVEFLGWIDPDRVLDLVAQATVVVVPSRREGLSMTTVQAASMARPIVASRVGGLPEVVVHQESGLLVDSEDTHDLAAAVSFLLDHPDDAARMGRAARERVEERFSLDHFVAAYDALYRTLTPRYACSP